MKTIYFFAKVGCISKKAFGGGEIGNRKTINMRKELGYNVQLIPRYYNYNQKNPLVYAQIIFGDLFSVMKLFFSLLFRKRTESCVHIVGFTGKYLFIELLSIFTAKLLRYTVIYEIRGGGIIDFYKNGSFLYKKMLQSAIHKSDCIFTQGKENHDLLKKLSYKKFLYYPNYIEPSFAPKSLPEKSISPIKLIYIGRLAPVKGVDLVLKIFKILKDSQLNVQLDIIGEATDFPDYEKELLNFVKTNNLSDYSHFHGNITHTEMIPLLQNALFFIFPSTEPREGQSNSLTEAMSYGVIPIASPQGYTRSIIENNLLIVDNLNPHDYAARISHILSNNLQKDLSKQVFDRVRNNFSYDIIKENVRCCYAEIFGENNG